MLLSFRAANHRSLRDEQHLLLTRVYQGDGQEGVRGPVPVAGIFGPNASGKSNVLDALTYMRHLVDSSFSRSSHGFGLGRRPFSLDPAAAHEDSWYVVDLLLNEPDHEPRPGTAIEASGIRYEYGFCVDDRRVTEEWMYSHPRGRRRKIFHRKLDAYTWGAHTAETMKSVAELVDSNVLFLSVAARARQTQVHPVYDWFLAMTTWKQAGSPMFPILKERRPRESDESYLPWLTGLLRAADTGIEEAEVIEETDDEFAARMKSTGGADFPSERNRTIVFRHRGENGTSRLGLRDQSAGTRTLYSLSLPIFRALRQGGTLVVDELDASLHPYVSAHLIELFQSPETNPQRTQLIFSVHDAALLGRIQGKEVLQRDQIWFTEKDECGRTELFPLTEFKPRKDENRGLRYLAGRYGAVPMVTDELILTTLARRGAADDVPPDPQA
ncbi:ATP-binding protein [Actinocorallia aurea]